LQRETKRARRLPFSADIAHKSLKLTRTTLWRLSAFTVITDFTVTVEE
jgi:hypothetical protein